MASIQQESVARPEARKKEGLTHSLEAKLKKFLADTVAVATAEVEKTHEELVTDPSLSEMEQNSLRDVAGMAQQQLEEALQEASGESEASEASAPAISEVPEAKPEDGPVTVPPHDAEGDLAQIDKEIKLLQNEIPMLKGRAYAQAVQRLEDLTQYEGELAPHASNVEEPMVVERIGDDKAPDVPAGRKDGGDELELSTQEAASAETVELDWGRHLADEKEQLEQAFQMIEAAEEVIADFKEKHADSSGLTTTEQQYLWALESDIAWYKAKGSFIENSMEGIKAQKTLQELQPTEENAEAIKEAKASLAKALENKAVLAAALVAATQKMQEARTSYSRSLEEAGVKVEASPEQEDAQEELDRAEEWSSGRAFDAEGGYHGSGVGADQTGPKDKEIFTLNGGGHAEKEEEGFFRETWKGLSGWLKSLFG